MNLYMFTESNHLLMFKAERGHCGGHNLFESHGSSFKKVAFFVHLNSCAIEKKIFLKYIFSTLN